MFKHLTGKHAGFTLIELIMVITLTGIIAGIVAVFIARPVEGYLAATTRAELADTAQNAVERIGREVRIALPNSVRVDGTGQFLEFIPTTAGGRYQTFVDGAGGELSFTAADSTFNVLSPTVNIANGQSVVFFNLGPGITGGDAYQPENTATSNRRLVGAGNNLATITMTSSVALPAGANSPPYRFIIVSQPVTIGCVGGQLLLYSNYGFQTAIGTPPNAVGTVASLLADGVSACNFSYAPATTAAKFGLVTVSLTLRRTPRGGSFEEVTLYHSVHVDNVP